MEKTCLKIKTIDKIKNNIIYYINKIMNFGKYLNVFKNILCIRKDSDYYGRKRSNINTRRIW